MSKKYTEYEIEFLKENYPKFGSEYCAKALKRGRNAITNQCYNLNIKLTGEQLSNIASNKNRSKYKNLYLPVFQNINTPELAYFLGYFWADGYLLNKGEKYRLCLSIKDTDYFVIKPILDKIAKFNTYIDKRGIANIKIQNKELVTYLHSLDFSDKSILQPHKILAKIPDNLKHYWWRGFFEGDGNIRKDRFSISISGPYEYKWDFVLNLFRDLNIKKPITKRCIRKNGKVSQILLWNKPDSKLFLDFIYKNAAADNIHIKRKLEIYSNLLYLESNPQIAKDKASLNRSKTILAKNPERGIFERVGRWMVNIQTTYYGMFSDKQAALNCFNFYGKKHFGESFIPSQVEKTMDKEQFMKFRTRKPKEIPNNLLA